MVGTRALLQKALNRREVRGQSLRRLDWKLGLESGEVVTRRTVFREPTNDPARMLFVLKGKIERLQLTAAATTLEVTLSGLCSEYGHQANLWPIGPRRHRELLEAIEQLNTRAKVRRRYSALSRYNHGHESPNGSWRSSPSAPDGLPIVDC